jgi:hypothetical protein
MLASFIAIHNEGPYNLALYDNSTNDETAKLLEEAGVPFITNGASCHGPTINKALNACKTDIALIVDTDIIFLQSIQQFINTFKKHPHVAAIGTISGSRGSGKNVHPRLDPWFMFINVALIKKFGITFYSKRKVSNDIIYDVGSSFLEDLAKHNLQVLAVQGMEKFATHWEGLSWYTHKYTVSGAIGDLDVDPSAMHNDKILYDRGIKREIDYQSEVIKYQDISLRGKFVSSIT